MPAAHLDTFVSLHSSSFPCRKQQGHPARIDAARSTLDCSMLATAICILLLQDLVDSQHIPRLLN
jgi:hypothetical protein